MSPISKITKGMKYQKSTLEELESCDDVLDIEEKREIVEDLKALNKKAKTFVGISVLGAFRNWSQISDWKRATKRLNARAAISSTTARADAMLVRNAQRNQAPSAKTATAMDLAGIESRDPFADIMQCETPSVTEIIAESPLEVLGIQRTVRFSNDIATSSSVEHIGLRPVKTRKMSILSSER